LKIFDNYIDKLVQRNLAEQRRSSKAKGEVGTANFGGFIQGEEFNAEWKDIKAVENADKMRRTDAQVNASLLAVELPILSSTSRIEPASQDNIDLKIAEFINVNLFMNRNFTWNYLLRHILKYLQFGAYVFEKVYEVVDSQIYIKNISPRLPKTIRRWNQNDDGTLKEVEQFATRPDGSYGTFTIPNKFLVLFTNNQEGWNWTGTSILRNAYRNWKIKDTLIRIDAMRHERQGLGIPIFTPPEDAKTEDIEACEKVGETLRSHEKSYIIKPHGWDVEFADLKVSSLTDIIPSIKFHNTEISSNILAQFMDVGKTDFGSRASIHELKENFFLSLQSTANYIEDIFNEGMEGRLLIKELVSFNFPNVDQYPKLKFSKIANIDYEKVSIYLKNLADSGFVCPRLEDEVHIREEFDLPEVEEKKEKPKETKPEVNTHEHSYKKMSERYWRTLTSLENKIGLKEIDNSMRDFEAELIEVVEKHRNFMTKELAREGIRLLNRRLSLKAFTKKTIEIKISGKARMAREISGKLKDIYQYGRDTVKSELKKITKLQEPGVPIIEDEQESKKAAVPWAELSVASLTTILHNEWRKELMRQKSLGFVNSDLLTDSMEALKNTVFKREMIEKARGMFGIGRSAEAMKQDVKKVIRSEIMDDKICRACRPIDGNEFTTDDPLWSKVAGGPYRNCEGGDACRGINIFVE